MMSRTESSPSQCKECGTIYTGGVLKWYWVNGCGPFCEKCKTERVFHFQQDCHGEWQHIRGVDMVVLPG